MPVLMVSNVKFGDVRYYSSRHEQYFINLEELVRLLPHIAKHKSCEVYVIEVRDPSGKLIKRFRPFKKYSLSVGEFWSNILRKWKPCLLFSENIISELSATVNYKLVLMISKYSYQSLLPFEIKPLGLEAEKFLSYLPKMETKLLLMSLNFPVILRKLLTNMAKFVRYGGPHLGPAPRTTTEMILAMTIDLLTYLTKSIENKTIAIGG